MGCTNSDQKDDDNIDSNYVNLPSRIYYDASGNLRCGGANRHNVDDELHRITVSDNIDDHVKSIFSYEDMLFCPK